MEVTKEMLIGDILREKPDAARILMEAGMHCITCPSAQMESLENASEVHGIPVEGLLEKLNA